MAQNETWLNHDLLDAVKVQYLDGNLFSMDNAGNLIGVKLTRDGVDYSGGGSVSANVIRADGATVSVIGALSGNAATVVLPQAAYAVPGVVSIVVKLTVSGEVTTIAAVVANVYQSSTDSVIDPGTIIPSVQNLISAIETAVASIPADYSALWTSLAPAFSTSTNYTTGQYVTYNGALYRFTTDHAAGAWNSSHVVAVNLGSEISDLKSAFNINNDFLAENSVSMIRAEWKYGQLNGTTGEESASNYRSITVGYIPFEKISTIYVPIGYSAFAFYYNLVSGNYVFQSYYTYKQASTQDETFAPESGHGDYVRMQVTAAHSGTMNADELDVVKLFQEMALKAEADETKLKAKRTNDNLFVLNNGIKNYSDALVAEQWKMGKLDTSGVEGESEYNSIMVDTLPVADVTRIHIPEGYQTIVHFYNYSGGSYVHTTYFSYSASSGDLEKVMPTIYGDYFRIMALRINATKITDDDIDCVKLLKTIQLKYEHDKLATAFDEGAERVPCSWERGGLRADGEEYTTNYRTRMVDYGATADTDRIITSGWAFTNILYFNASDVWQATESFNGKNIVDVNKNYPKFRIDAYRYAGGQIQDDQVVACILLKANYTFDALKNTEVFDSGYLGNYVIDVSAKVNEFCDLFANGAEDIEAFMFYTDPHLQSAEYSRYYKLVYLGMQRFFNNAPVSFVVDNGDWLGADDTPAQACEKLGYYDGTTKWLFGDHYYPVVGNHDTNSQGTEAISNATLKNLHFRKFDGLYYQFDGINTHCFVLNCGTVGTSETDYYNEQIAWLANALQSGNHNHYAIFAHAYYTAKTGTAVCYLTDKCAEVADAYNRRGTYTYNGVTYNFTGCTGRVEFMMCGHAHADRNTKEGTMPIIITTKASDDYTATFEAVYADYDNNILYCIRVGSGSNRTFNLATGDIIT